MIRLDLSSTQDWRSPRWRGFLCIRESLRRIVSGSSFIRNSSVFRSDEGATLVEMAMASIIFFVLLFGIFEISLASYTYHYVSDAAREGARWAIVRGSMCSLDLPWAPSSFDCDATGDQISDYVKSLGYPGIDSRNMTVSTIWLAGTASSTTGSSSTQTSTTTWGTTACGTSDACKYPGNEVQVTVSYNFPLQFVFWSSASFPISSTSTMVISQ